MKAEILLFVDKSEDVVLACEVSIEGQISSYLIDEYGRELENWPMDLGAYDRSHGLCVWEGTIDDDLEEFEGSIRELTPMEWQQLRQGKSVIL